MISSLCGDDIPSYIISIIINSTYLSTLFITRFKPSYHVIKNMMSILIAYYVFDTNKLLNNNNDKKEKYTYILHHIVSVSLIMGQVANIYPLSIGMWYLTMFEFSNFFLQFFNLAQNLGWMRARNIIAYPFALTYIPLRGVAIPIYSIKFYPYLVTLTTSKMILFFSLFSFINIFSMYFSYVVLMKFITHLQKVKHN